MRVYAFCNQKGGVGKTTSCLNLGYALGLYSKNVLCIDLDPQANLTSGFGKNGTRGSVYEAMIRKRTIDEILTPINERVNLVPSSHNLVGLETEFLRDESGYLLLRDLIYKLDRWNYILIDTPPSLGMLTVNALCAAQGVIIPVQSEYYALEGLTHLLKTIKRTRDLYHPLLQIRGFLLTLFDKRVRLSFAIEEEVRKVFKDKVFKTIIPRSIRLAEAPSFGKPIFEYAKDSKGAEGYIGLAGEIIEKDEKETTR